jgi:Protein of unknown function (DUF2490)
MELLRYFFIIIVFVSCHSASGQTKTTTTTGQAWFAFFNQTRLSNKWGVFADVHLRTRENYFSNLSVGIIRLGGTYYLNDNTRLTAAYAFVNLFPAGSTTISVPEHRPWQQIQWHTNYPKMKLMQWVRLEERWRRRLKNANELSDDYSFNFRLRYSIQSQLPLSKKRFQPGTFSFVLSNEVFINFGKQIVFNTFDQNRFFAGFNYHVNKRDNLQFGYINVFQQLAAGNQYRSINAMRLFYFHQLDLRRQEIKK